MFIRSLTFMQEVSICQIEMTAYYFHLSYILRVGISVSVNILIDVGTYFVNIVKYVFTKLGGQRERKSTKFLNLVL